MKRSKPIADTASERPSRTSKYLTLFIWVAGVCLSFGAYTFLVNALVPGVAREASGPSHSRVAPDAPPLMEIEPATTYVEAGETFSVTVMIRDVEDLGGFEFELTYNSSVVQTDTVELGSFLGSTGRDVGEVGPIYATGSLRYGAFSFGDAAGPDGDGALAILTFQATSAGTSTLHLQNIIALKTDGASLSPTTEDGEVVVGASAPSVTRITPNSGEFGDVLENVIVDGQNFLTNATVQLTKSGQNIPASWTAVQSSTRISCTLNLGKAPAGQWDVIVINPDGKSGTLPNGFTIIAVDPPPKITSVTPNSACSNQVVPVNLSGSDFQSGATATLTRADHADIEATNVVVVSDSQISCDFDLGGADPGLWTMRVTNLDGQYDELDNGFTVDMCLYLPEVLKNY